VKTECLKKRVRYSKATSPRIDVWELKKTSHHLTSLVKSVRQLFASQRASTITVIIKEGKKWLFQHFTKEGIDHYQCNSNNQFSRSLH